ncbi:branched-chain amino acid ABC transporter substrate-binding protein [Malaciobacter molluscorum LMG 25693]|uniref:Branched-chain amino acid ABC transporter substrate-binding protein n=1 Tax=Malaciobacter molluscorum LMG 25693 TaxID=870501 RepID=A0A2G1DLG1_9BACT|nr:ABC transporter substrate-binding protein [Malaciobacter molluscorum]AXX92081.1 high-affinity branched-chain amino acid ABC transporter, periplasmic Leu/Ile/Val-binding protein [Malaciobacter molluscorum LMG 25693]PHO19310.1 branched-chain amino acid ABC transporter substrate-binding protein [Malaciobacter molluscorum LMG 25693]RXJ96429.1 branched-chain amino acid ABC transporter substrate-binding protein [Malaciobacter molluscorum]
MRKIIGLSVATALTCTMALAKEINVGLILPMSGAIAAYGQNAEVGVKLAHKLQPKLNNGDKINLILIDNKGDKVETANAATRLISSDKVVALLGPMISTNTAQVISIAEKKHVPVIAPAATNDKLTMRKMYANRVCFTDSFQGSVVANYALKQNKKKAVVIVDQATVYSLGLSKAFKNTYTKGGGKILKKIRITSGDKDYKAIISQIKKLNPDIIFLPLYHPEASMIARQAKELGLKTTMISGDGVANQTFIDLGGDAVNGYLYTDAFDYTNPPTKKSAEFIKAYQKQTGSNALNAFSALGADTYNLLVNAMNKCEDPTNSKCINKEIKNTKKFEAVTGIISIDKEGNAIKSAVIKEIVNGKPVYKATVNP